MRRQHATTAISRGISFILVVVVILLLVKDGNSFCIIPPHRTSHHTTAFTTGDEVVVVVRTGGSNNVVDSLRLPKIQKRPTRRFHLLMTKDNQNTNDNESSSQPLSTPLLFQQDGRELAFDEDNALVQEVLEKIDGNDDCNPLDARWALEAKNGNVLDAVIAISVARRLAAQPATTIPQGDDFGSAYEKRNDDNNKVTKEKWAEKRSRERERVEKNEE